MRKIVVKLYKRFCYWLSVLWRALLLLLIDVVILFLYDSPSFYRDEYAREELKDKEEDLLFYLEYWNKFPSTFKRIAQKEIDQLEDDIKND